MIGEAGTWAKQHGVPVICDEFGAYSRTAPAADRLAWLKDVRTAFDKHGVAWTLLVLPTMFCCSDCCIPPGTLAGLPVEIGAGAVLAAGALDDAGDEQLATIASSNSPARLMLARVKRRGKSEG